MKHPTREISRVTITIWGHWPLKTNNPHHHQLFYAQFAAALVALNGLTEPRPRRDAKAFLTYQSGHCVSYREQAFHRICAHMERVSGARCHATKCFGGYTKALIQPTAGYWIKLRGAKLASSTRPMVLRHCDSQIQKTHVYLH